MTNITIEEGLLNNGYIVYGFKGTSMNPMLKSGRDKAYIEKVTKPLKKGDIALYKRLTGEYVLHRVIKAKKGVALQHPFLRGLFTVPNPYRHKSSIDTAYGVAEYSKLWC